jgi:hypothetical protein
MNDFIADDEDVEAELLEEAAQKHKTAKRKKRRAEQIEELDEEDEELIRENVGIEVKRRKKKLKKIASIEADYENPALKKEEEMQIDTRSTKPALLPNSIKNESVLPNSKMEVESSTKFKRQRMEVEEEEKYHTQNKINPDYLQKAQKIFGDQNDQPQQQKLDSTKAVPLSMKDVFNADEIDDPFNTEADHKIAETDIPERLQVKLEDRL